MKARTETEKVTLRDAVLKRHRDGMSQTAIATRMRLSQNTVTAIVRGEWDSLDNAVLKGSPGDWQDRGLCAQTDPEAFFPEKGGSTREAKRVCTGCEVRAECLEYALAHDERFGIWGGLSERERRKLNRRAA